MTPQITLYWYLCKQVHSVSMIKEIRIFRNCGVVFDLDRRIDRDCPVCQHGEHLAFERDAINHQSQIPKLGILSNRIHSPLGSSRR